MGWASLQALERPFAPGTSPGGFVDKSKLLNVASSSMLLAAPSLGNVGLR